MIERLLNKHDVADRLQVSPKKAACLMKQMRRINISSNPNSQRPRWVVTESEIDRWKMLSMQEPQLAAVEKPRRKPTFTYDPNLFEPDGRIKRRKSR